MANGALGIEKLLAIVQDIDAIFFANDDLALGALFYCQSQGIPVPGKIALAGFNGLEMCQSINPRLTTISTPRYEMGRLAGDLILRKINGETIEEPLVRQLDLELIAGETT